MSGAPDGVRSTHSGCSTISREPWVMAAGAIHRPAVNPAAAAAAVTGSSPFGKRVLVRVGVRVRVRVGVRVRVRVGVRVGVRVRVRVRVGVRVRARVGVRVKG